MTDISKDAVEELAKAIAFSGRHRHDVSRDAQEFWDHTGSFGQSEARVQARAALSALPPQQVSVADAAKVADEHADRYAMKAAIYRGGSNLCAHYTTLSKVSRSIADDIRALTGEDQ